MHLILFNNFYPFLQATAATRGSLLSDLHVLLQLFPKALHILVKRPHYPAQLINRNINLALFSVRNVLWGMSALAAKAYCLICLSRRVDTMYSPISCAINVLSSSMLTPPASLLHIAYYKNERPRPERQNPAFI